MKNCKQITNIGHVREIIGLTQQKLAECIGVKREMIAYWESGSRIPNTKDLIKLRNFFKEKNMNVSIDYLLGLTDTKSWDGDKIKTCDYLGLSENAVENIVECVEAAKASDKFFCGRNAIALSLDIAFSDKWINNDELSKYYEDYKKCFDKTTVEEINDFLLCCYSENIASAIKSYIDHKSKETILKKAFNNSNALPCKNEMQLIDEGKLEQITILRNAQAVVSDASDKSDFKMWKLQEEVKSTLTEIVDLLCKKFIGEDYADD